MSLMCPNLGVQRHKDVSGDYINIIDSATCLCKSFYLNKNNSYIGSPVFCEVVGAVNIYLQITDLLEDPHYHIGAI